MPTFLIGPIIQHAAREKKGGITHISHAACKHRKAILGPTPGSEHSSSTVFGTSESNSSRRRCAACLMYLNYQKKQKQKLSAPTGWVGKTKRDLD